MRITLAPGTALLGFSLVATGAMGAQNSAPATDAGTLQSTHVAADAGVQSAVVSQVRIVRLSEVRGVVQLDRNTGRGYEDAFTNIPVTHGTKLRTGNGLAEVEFEDNSTLRLTPYSVVSFEQLGRNASGATVTGVHVQDGTAYVKLAKTKGNVFTLGDGQASIDVMPGSHVRLAARTKDAELAVFDGEARVATAADAGAVVGKKQTYVFDPAGQEEATLAKKTEAATYDQWDKNQVEYHSQRASFAGSGGGSMYGANDLMYYGSFANLGGCGMAWRPYFASAAFDPFANGTWAWYPGAGYSWVSPYPWGWLPFHSGTWQQCGGAGWAWLPGGGGWYGLNNAVALRGTAVSPTHGPELGKGTLIQVNQRPLLSSGAVQGQDAFAFRKDSAGLGVPRQTFGHLGDASAMAVRHDTVMTPVSREMLMPGARPNAVGAGQGGWDRGERDAATSRGNVPANGAAANNGRSATYSMPSSAPSSAPRSYSAPASSAPGAATAAGHK